MDGDTPDADPGPGADRSALRDLSVLTVEAFLIVCKEMIRNPIP
jgi:hypothetical protein